MRVAGIDPGLTGAIALMYEDDLRDIIDMPTSADGVSAHGLAEVLAGFGALDAVVVERQQAMPRQGVSSSFKTGTGYGIILGVLAVMERRVLHVRANAWTRDMAVGSDKARHRSAAMDRFPAMAASFSRVRDDGRADAALIAAWGVRALRVDRGLVSA